MRIECPVCNTSYASERLGLPVLKDQQSAVVTVKCLVCGQDFNARVTPNLVTVVPGWWKRVVLRRKPTTTQDGHAVTTALREG